MTHPTEAEIREAKMLGESYEIACIDGIERGDGYILSMKDCEELLKFIQTALSVLKHTLTHGLAMEESGIRELLEKESHPVEAIDYGVSFDRNKLASTLAKKMKEMIK